MNCLINKLYRTLYFMPFGRISLDTDHSEAVGEFVERGGARAYLIDTLTKGGSRGSYLITGRRGVGKTTFVNHCLEEYQANVFQRFLRSNHGRSLLDKSAMVFFASLVVLGNLIPRSQAPAWECILAKMFNLDPTTPSAWLTIPSSGRELVESSYATAPWQSVSEFQLIKAPPKSP